VASHRARQRQDQDRAVRHRAALASQVSRPRRPGAQPVLRPQGRGRAVLALDGSRVSRGTWTDPAAGKITLRRYVEQVYLPAQVTEATSQRSTESRFRTRILPSLGDKTLGQLAVEPSVIKAWAAGLRSELSDGYVRVLLASLSGR